MSKETVFYSLLYDTTPEAEDVIIDSNEVMDDYIHQHEIENKRAQDIRAMKLAQEEFGDEYAEYGEPDYSEEFPEGYEGYSESGEYEGMEDAGGVSMAPPPEPSAPAFDTAEIDRMIAEANEQAESIIADANSQAEEIMLAAQNEAEALKFNEKKVGKEEGLAEGMQEATKRQMELEDEYEQKKAELDEEYEQKKSEVESELLDTLIEVVEKVFLAEFGDSKEIIHHLVENTIANVDISKEFLIRLNEENASYLKEHKAEIQDKVGQEAVIDIAIDPLLDSSQCMIETDGGLFDCGVDTQFNNLIKKLKALS